MSPEPRADVAIAALNQYFFTDRERASANFSIDLEDGAKTFAELSEEKVRDFREYAIPTIEISLEGSSLDEIIDLFIDINQQGSKVNRFDIVKAIGRENPLLRSVFDLLATSHKRQHDVFYKKKKNEFTKSLERLQIIRNIIDPNSRVDRMWERLLEIALFVRTGKHRAPAQILKSFIRSRADVGRDVKMTPAETKKLSACFKFIVGCYSRSPQFATSRFAVDQTHFYTMITSIIGGDLLKAHGGPPARGELERKLVKFAKIMDGKAKPPKAVAMAVEDYQTASAKQTTHIGQREARQARFLEILGAI